MRRGQWRNSHVQTMRNLAGLVKSGTQIQYFRQATGKIPMFVVCYLIDKRDTVTRYVYCLGLHKIFLGIQVKAMYWKRPHLFAIVLFGSTPLPQPLSNVFPYLSLNPSTLWVTGIHNTFEEPYFASWLVRGSIHRHDNKKNVGHNKFT